jgi:sugar lactone lactonase YvrE
MTSPQVDLVLDIRAALGEGPVWHVREQRLYWVDIPAGNVHVHDPNGEPDRVYEVGQMVGAAVPRRAGGLVLAAHQGLGTYDLARREFTLLAAPKRHLPDNRFNDGKCDPRGRFWAGTLSMVRQPRNAHLYCLDTDRTLRHMLGDVTTSNGLAWSLDGRTMYYIDTPTRQVSAFDFDAETGEISNRRTIIAFPPGVGRPDGMTIDADGRLWIAHWDGGRVSRWDADSGRLLQEIRLPVINVTSCAFGGVNLDRLYITTARQGLTDEQLREQPHAGSLFALTPGVAGLPAHEYLG